MLSHHWEKVAGYEVEVRKGFCALKQCAFTATAENPIRNFRDTVIEKSRISQLVFGGVERCLYPVQKFQSDTERKLAIILDRESLKWFKPALGQFQIFYKSGLDHREYQPDFATELPAAFYLLEAKAGGRTSEADVLAKRDAAVQWCKHATEHVLKFGGKPWQYLLIPHESVTDNMTIEGLVSAFVQRE